MTIRIGYASAVVTIALILSPILFSAPQTTPKSVDQKLDKKADQKFDPHDLSGVWRGDASRPGARNFASYDQTIPEPPLTEWGKQHLLYKSISHDALGGQPLPAKFRPGHVCPDNQNPCYSADPNGVPANQPDGEYPGKDCEPLAAPATYDVGALGAMELFYTREGDRIFQLLEYHREWRTWWLNRDHPRDLDPTYEGDSTARWEGNTLVVDTIGFNGKSTITQNVGHRKSDAFHLVERFTLMDQNHLVLDMTYYDPKAWGDKSWPGFRKYFHRVPKEDFEEFICSPREYQEYNSRVTSPMEAGPGK